MRVTVMMVIIEHVLCCSWSESWGRHASLVAMRSKLMAFYFAAFATWAETRGARVLRVGGVSGARPILRFKWCVSLLRVYSRSCFLV